MNIKIYWTKYALTTGIKILDVYPPEWSKDTYISSIYPSEFFSDSNKKDWYKSKDAALIQAEIMREKKLLSIKKQKAKIEHIDFKSQIS